MEVLEADRKHAFSDTKFFVESNLKMIFMENPR